MTVDPFRVVGLDSSSLIDSALEPKEIKREGPLADWQNLWSLSARVPFLAPHWYAAWNACYGGIDFELLADNDTLVVLSRKTSNERSTLFVGFPSGADYWVPIHEYSSIPSTEWTHFLAAEAERCDVFLHNVSSDADFLKALRQISDILVTDTERTSQVAYTIPFKRGTLLHSSATRMQAGRDLRRLVRDGCSVSLFVEGSDSVHRIAEMVELHTKRWETKGLPGKFSDSKRVCFVERLMRTHPTARLSVLEYQGKMLAFRFGFQGADTFYSWLSGFDPEFSSRGPGSALLLAEILEVLQRGDTYDFMRGDESYKTHYANRWSEVVTARVLPFSSRARTQ